MKMTFKDFFKSTETHPFDFNENWEQLEYESYRAFKKTLRTEPIVKNFSTEHSPRQ